jgi:hypothetical protein
MQRHAVQPDLARNIWRLRADSRIGYDPRLPPPR